MIAELIELVSQIRKADQGLRDGSVVGESEADAKSRRFVGLACKIAIILLGLGGFLFWMMTRG